MHNLIATLKPVSHSRVYDLVRDAGVDVSGWADYKRSEHPASNPNFCYEWAFEASDRVVVCLWFQEMQTAGDVVFQNLNYRAIAASRRNWNATQRERAATMDHAIQFARLKYVPIRVIVVDGSRRSDADDQSRSKVERRLLDPVSWFVAAYDEDGNCRLQRGEPPPTLVTPEAGTMAGTDRLARIAYNSSGWQHPTGEAGAQESGETYNAQNKFGHEDWLFRAEWVLDGWRYAFIQGLNKGRESYLGQSLNVTLYTIQPDKRRRLVATIYGLESLSDQQADDALNTFRDKGWLKTMQDEVRAIGGKAEALGAPEWAPHVLNVRFRQDGVDPHPPETFLADDEWLQNRHRYMLYKLEGADLTRIEQTHVGRSGTQTAPNANPLFRRGTKPMSYTPEHARMQTKLLAELQAEYGKEHVWLETDFVDARVETDKELIFFEIKSDLDPRAVIRQALGQILEYAYHPVREGRRPDRLVIVGRTALGAEDTAYLNRLCKEFTLPLSYRVVAL
jgi:hypothetical protein